MRSCVEDYLLSLFGTVICKYSEICSDIRPNSSLECVAFDELRMKDSTLPSPINTIQFRCRVLLNLLLI